MVHQLRMDTAVNRKHLSMARTIRWTYRASLSQPHDLSTSRMHARLASYLKIEKILDCQYVALPGGFGWTRRARYRLATTLQRCIWALNGIPPTWSEAPIASGRARQSLALSLLLLLQPLVLVPNTFFPPLHFFERSLSCWVYLLTILICEARTNIRSNFCSFDKHLLDVAL